MIHGCNGTFLLSVKVHCCSSRCNFVQCHGRHYMQRMWVSVESCAWTNHVHARFSCNPVHARWWVLSHHDALIFSFLSVAPCLCVVLGTIRRLNLRVRIFEKGEKKKEQNLRVPPDSVFPSSTIELVPHLLLVIKGETFGFHLLIQDLSFRFRIFGVSKPGRCNILKL